jgi:hypothetical protein
MTRILSLLAMGFGLGGLNSTNEAWRYISVAVFGIGLICYINIRVNDE